MKHPKYPLGQLATFELRNYRAELERAIAELPPSSAEVDRLRARLDEVIEAQEVHARVIGLPVRAGSAGERAEPATGPVHRTGRESPSACLR